MAKATSIDEHVDGILKLWKDKFEEHIKPEHSAKFVDNMEELRTSYKQGDFKLAEYHASGIHRWAANKSDWCEGTDVGFEYVNMSNITGYLQDYIWETSEVPEFKLKAVNQALSWRDHDIDSMRSLLDMYSDYSQLNSEKLTHAKEQAIGFYEKQYTPASKAVESILADEKIDADTKLMKLKPEVNKIITAIGFMQAAVSFVDIEYNALENKCVDLQQSTNVSIQLKSAMGSAKSFRDRVYKAQALLRDAA